MSVRATAQLRARIDQRRKCVVEAAAHLRGITLSEFLREAAVREAIDTFDIAEAMPPRAPVLGRVERQPDDPRPTVRV